MLPVVNTRVHNGIEKSCVICRGEISIGKWKYKQQTKMIESMLGKLPVRCHLCVGSNAEDSVTCSWTGILEELTKHSKVCHHRFVDCKHSTNGCRHKIRQGKTAALHEADCFFGFKLCTLNCGIPVRLENLENHVKNECVNRMVRCPLSTKGICDCLCPESLPLSSLVTHLCCEFVTQEDTEMSFEVQQNSISQGFSFFIFLY